MSASLLLSLFARPAGAERVGLTYHGVSLEQPAAWEDVGLSCWLITEPEASRRLDAFEAAVSSVRIVDGAVHPMKLSPPARYYRSWPWRHPLLQLPVLLLLLTVGFFAAAFFNNRRS